jgi:hypothetical protein
MWLAYTHGAAPHQQMFLSLLFHPLRDAQGQITALLDFSYDITEQVQLTRLT